MDKRSGGFSLVEMLVVLVITALTASLVLQGVGQGAALLGRIGANQADLYRDAMMRGWLRQCITASVANTPARDTFTGDAGELHLRTFRPLLAAEGIATEVSIAVTSAGALRYREGEQQFDLHLGVPVARLAYQDAGSRWQERWPLDERHLLPERVRVELRDGERMDIALVTQRQPLVHADELLFERD